ncbi:MAG: hypothetical protein L6437_13305 [Kiritimatiellae bacterium]|nr:hypothetical protein [Kiritimatiellia bacterium]
MKRTTMSASHLSIKENFIKAVRREIPQRIPVASCLSTGYICDLFNVPLKDYYFNSELKLKTQLAFQDKYPGLMLIPGIYPDFGCGTVITSGFGCEIVQNDNMHPLCPKPCLHDIQDITRLKLPDPDKDGYLPLILKEYQYFWKHLDKRYTDEYGYLDGFAFMTGPTEVASLLMGHQNFFIQMVENPQDIHQLLDKVTDGVMRWLRAQERINGKLKRIYCLEHTPAHISLEHSRGFVLPYMTRILREFPQAVRIYHICDAHILHTLPMINEMEINVLHFADDISIIKEGIRKDICLMGNLNTITFVHKGTPEQMDAEAQRCISIAAEESGGYVLAPHGALVPGTPVKNIETLFNKERFYPGKYQQRNGKLHRP